MTRAIILGIALLFVGAHGFAEEVTSGETVPGGNPLKLDDYYTEPLTRTGSFPGRLVCISTQKPYVTEAATPCGHDEVYALSVDRPQTVLPLIGAADEAARQFPVLLGQKVVVRGKHYPDKAVIAVGTVERAATAADAPEPVKLGK
jgi:hypothetical protein